MKRYSWTSYWPIKFAKECVEHAVIAWWQHSCSILHTIASCLPSLAKSYILCVKCIYVYMHNEQCYQKESTDSKQNLKNRCKLANKTPDQIGGGAPSNSGLAII